MNTYLFFPYSLILLNHAMLDEINKEVSKNKHIKYSVLLIGFSVTLSVIITQRTTEETLRYTEDNHLKTLIFDNS